MRRPRRAKPPTEASEEPDLGVEPAPPVTPLTRSGDSTLFTTPRHTSAGDPATPARAVGTDSWLLFEVSAGVYASLPFDALADEVFGDLVIARVGEPTSLLDSDRVLRDLEQSPASYATMKRTLDRAVEGGYRDQVATACFAHVLTGGDLSLVLYDVTVRCEALVVRVEVRGLCLIACRGMGLKLGA